MSDSTTQDVRRLIEQTRTTSATETPKEVLEVVDPDSEEEEGEIVDSDDEGVDGDDSDNDNKNNDNDVTHPSEQSRVCTNHVTLLFVVFVHLVIVHNLV